MSSARDFTLDLWLPDLSIYDEINPNSNHSDSEIDDSDNDVTYEPDESSDDDSGRIYKSKTDHF